MSKHHFQLIIFLFSFLLSGLFLGLDQNAPRTRAATGTAITANLTNNGADYVDYSSETVNSTAENPIIPKYEKFELTFDITRGGTNITREIDDGTINPYWPYDANPASNAAHPGAIPAGKGISVDGLFLKPGGDWGDSSDIVTQPGFIYQGFERQILANGSDWLYPEGERVWKIRFAPTEVNTWQYKIRITDSTGETYSTVSSFSAVGSTNKGFVQISRDDPRYFQTSNGDYLNLTGLNYDETSNVMAKADEYFPELKTGGINLVRNWWQGSQGPVLWGIGGQGSVMGGDGGWDNINSDAYISTVEPKTGQLFSGKFALSLGESYVNKSAFTNVNVIAGRTYKFSAYVKTKNVDNFDGTSKFYLNAYRGGSKFPIDDITFNEDHDWTLLSGEYTVPIDSNITSIDLQIGVERMKLKDGASIDDQGAWFTDVSVKEVVSEGAYGPEMVAIPNFNMQQYVNQRTAWKADYVTELAKANDIYLNVVVEEMFDPVFGLITADGQTELEADPVNVYADDTSANRVYQQYYWRYFMARYDYSTAIHSLELFNEAAPSAAHANALESFANYMKNTLASNHLTTSSLPTDLKSKSFWSTASDLGIATWHKYISSTIGGHHLGFNEVAPNFDSTYYSSAPYSFKISTGADNTKLLPKNMIPIPVTPGDNYKLKWKISSRNMQAGPDCKAYVGMTFKSGSELDGSNDVSEWLTEPNNSPNINSNISWTEKEMTKTANHTKSSDEAKYVSISPTSDHCAGDIYFDDLELTDLTTGKRVNLPNGNFDEMSMDEDSALITYWIGSQVGRIFESSATMPKVPVILGETGLSDPNHPSDPTNYPNPELANDTEGIWYKKFIWGEINPYSITSLYWGDDQTYKRDPSFLGYAKAYQNFMSGVQLSNGNYSDVEATTSDNNLRAWGQKEMDGSTATKAHLWIDNKPYTWKAVVDESTPSTISGTVTIPNMKDGLYKVEWWNTSTGTVEKTEVKEASSNNVTLSVSDLVSDTAVKLTPTTMPEVSVTSGSNATTLNDSITVKYKVDNGAEQSKYYSLSVGENNLTLEVPHPYDSSRKTTASIQVTRKPAYTLQGSYFGSSWNMVSFPYLKVLLSNGIPSGYKVRKYNSSSNSYENLEGTDVSITPGSGYWIKADDPAKFDNFKYESENLSSVEIPVSKGWALLGNPFDSNLPLSNLTVKYKDGSTRSYQDAINRKEVSGYVWSYESKANPKQYYFVAINPEKYRTTAFKQTSINPFRGFWMIVKSDNISSIVMNK